MELLDEWMWIVVSTLLECVLMMFLKLMMVSLGRFVGE